MKKTSIFACVALNLLASPVSRGQASFWLNNAHGGGGVNAPVFDAQGVPLEGVNYFVELWGAATPDSLAPTLGFYTRQRIIIPFFTGSSAGYFRDSYAGRDGADHPTVLDVPAFGWAWLQARAWDARLGTTYEEVVSRGVGGYGESPLFYAQGSSPDLLTVGAPLIGLQSFNLRPVVPEPSTWALLALGGTVFFSMLRRRSKERL